MSRFTNVAVWAHGLFAAMISAFATAASGAIALPTVFNFTVNGFENMAKLATIPALLAAFAYLKQSPLPTESATITTTATVTKTDN